MPTAHFNIGSNLGNRLANIGKAVALLEDKIGTRARVSTPVFTAPWGFESANQFANVGISISTCLSPSKLLSLALQAEREIDPLGCHRTATGGYADRMIDIDLICVDSVVSEVDPELPHPRMHLRDFVLKPLAELMPEWIDPRSGLTPKELLEALHKIKTREHTLKS